MIVNVPTQVTVDSVLELLRLLSDPKRAFALIEELKRETLNYQEHAAASIAAERKAKDAEQAAAITAEERSQFSAKLADLTRNRLELEASIRGVVQRERAVAAKEAEVAARGLEQEAKLGAAIKAAEARAAEATQLTKQLKVEREAVEQTRKALIAAVGG
jgi:hypothetical protein